MILARKLSVFVAAALASVALLAPQAEAQTGTYSVTLSWLAPTTNTDGTPLTDLSGYTLYYSSVARPTGCTSTTAACGTWLTGALSVNVPTGTQFVLTSQNLTPATRYYFSLIAKKATGAVSVFSNEASATTPDPRVPGAPTNVSVTIVFNAT